MNQIPRDKSIDSTLALLADPYGFITQRAKMLRTDIFETRIMGQKTICFYGQEAAAIFYNQKYFMRKGAAPEPLKATLFGRGGLQVMDDDAHDHRKKMFMSLMTPNQVGRLVQVFTEWLDTYSSLWELRKEIVLYEEMKIVLTRAVCDWSGVPLRENELHERAKELSSMFDQAGSKGLGHLQARFNRMKTEKWISDLIEEVRLGKYIPPKSTPLHIIAWHRDLNGKLLKPHQAAVEVLNILRPTVAIAVYTVFCAHALHFHPECQRKIREKEKGYTDLFIQEVRRIYPFFPSVIARVRDNFEWQGFKLEKGKRVMLDLYGTNHDPRIWQNPDVFDPYRFRNWNGSSNNFIPQGGGDYSSGHRCPGEWITIELMKVATEFFVMNLEYTVPKQELSLDHSKLPAMPKSHFFISNVKKPLREETSLEVHLH